jgi:hypothetical protein
VNEDRYVLDANVLSRLTPEQRASAFVKEFCRVPTEVLFETGGLPDSAVIRELELRVGVRTLERLRDVMATIDPEDRSVVDLYRNKGGADPVLVAAALAADHDEDSLWGTEWHIVTDDNAVRRLAETAGVPWLSRSDLVARIDG